jgi:hypothetical protein
MGVFITDIAVFTSMRVEATNRNMRIINAKIGL